MATAKPRVATTSLAGCFGCHMSLLDIDEQIFDLVELIDFDASPINDFKRLSGPVDVGLVEGGCSSDDHVEVLRHFRQHCGTLISVGACALTGGVPSMRNVVPLRECLEEAFLHGPTVVDGVIPHDPDLPELLDRVYPCHEVVQIDLMLPGCPPPAEAFWNTISALLTGKEIDMPYTAFKYD